MTARHERILYAVLFFGVLLSDQLSKILVARSFPFGQPVPVLGRVFMIRYLHNPGTVFGLFSAYPGAVFAAKLVGLTVLIALVLYLLVFGGIRKNAVLDTVSLKASLVIIASSAIANFIDRVRTGAVIDFIDIGFGQYRWHTFNPADAYLVIGTVLIILSMLRHRDVSNTANTGHGA